MAPAAAAAVPLAAPAQHQQQTVAPPRGGGAVASLSHMWDHSRMFVAGGAAGAAARTATAPLDRIKLLFQVQAVPSAGTSATAYTGVGQAAAKILREEGVAAFWKGNGLNIIRWVGAGVLCQGPQVQRDAAVCRPLPTHPTAHRPVAASSPTPPPSSPPTTPTSACWLTSTAS